MSRAAVPQGLIGLDNLFPSSFSLVGLSFSMAGGQRLQFFANMVLHKTAHNWHIAFTRLRDLRDIYIEREKEKWRERVCVQEHLG